MSLAWFTEWIKLFSWTTITYDPCNADVVSSKKSDPILINQYLHTCLPTHQFIQFRNSALVITWNQKFYTREQHAIYSRLSVAKIMQIQIALLQSCLPYTASSDTSRRLWNVVKYTQIHQYVIENRQKAATQGKLKGKQKRNHSLTNQTNPCKTVVLE